MPSGSQTGKHFARWQRSTSSQNLRLWLLEGKLTHSGTSAFASSFRRLRIHALILLLFFFLFLFLFLFLSFLLFVSLCLPIYVHMQTLVRSISDTDVFFSGVFSYSCSFHLTCIPATLQSSLLHSQPKSTVGTPAYIAPEVLSKKEYDGKVAVEISSTG